MLITLFYAAVVTILYYWFDLKVTEFGAKKTYFFNVVILAPVIEELIFRLPLRNFFKNIFISVGLLTFVIVKGYVPLLLAILLGLVVALLPYATKLTKEKEENVNSFVVRHYGYLFYFLAISFGVLHILNAEFFTSDMYMSAFIFVINPVLVGLYFAFIRVKLKHGIIYSMILHSLTNLLHYLPAFF